jgi:hypothetical protein
VIPSHLHQGTERTPSAPKHLMRVKTAEKFRMENLDLERWNGRQTRVSATWTMGGMANQ